MEVLCENEVEKVCSACLQSLPLSAFYCCPKSKQGRRPQCKKCYKKRYYTEKPKPTAEERFWRKVCKEGPLSTYDQTPCWAWIGGKDAAGYGQFWFKGKQVLAHRWVIRTKLRPGELALHACDNPSCVNPVHLYPSDYGQNMQDCVERGRKPRGEAHSNAKLSWGAVEEIRASEETVSALSRAYRVSRATIMRVQKEQAWKR